MSVTPRLRVTAERDKRGARAVTILTAVSA